MTNLGPYAMKLLVTQRAQNKSNIISNQSPKTHLVTTKIKSHIHIHPQPSLLRNPPPLCYQNAIYAEKLVSLQGSLYKFANNFSKNQTHHSIYEEYIYLHIGRCLLYIYTHTYTYIATTTIWGVFLVWTSFVLFQNTPIAYV